MAKREMRKMIGFTKYHLYTYRFSHFANIFSRSRQFDDKCIAGLKNMFVIRKIYLQGLLQKFCVTQPFFHCGNAVAMKLCAHVTEDRPSTNTKYRSNLLKITPRKIMIAVTQTAVPKDEEQSVIYFLMLENVLGSEIYARMCVVYGMQNVITKSLCELMDAQIQDRMNKYE